MFAGLRELKEEVVLPGRLKSSSSNSGDERSTSGDGDNSLRRSFSASSDLDAALDIEGVITAR